MNDIVYAGKHATKTTVSRHQHKDMELIYCTSGGGQMLFDDFSLPYTEGDIVVIPPFLALLLIATCFTSISGQETS